MPGRVTAGDVVRAARREARSTGRDITSGRTSTRITGVRRTGPRRTVVVEETQFFNPQTGEVSTTRQAGFDVAFNPREEGALSSLQSQRTSRLSIEAEARAKEQQARQQAEAEFKAEMQKPSKIQKQFFTRSPLEFIPGRIGERETQKRIDVSQKLREQAELDVFKERTFRAQATQLQKKREAATERRAGVAVGKIQQELQTGITEGALTLEQAEKQFGTRVKTEVQPQFISDQLRDIATRSALTDELASRPIPIPRTQNFLASRRISPTTKDTGKTLAQLSKEFETRTGTPIGKKIAGIDLQAPLKQSSFATDKVESLTIGGAARTGAQLGLVFAGASAVKGLSSLGVAALPKSVVTSQVGRLGIGIGAVEAGGFGLDVSTRQLALGKKGRKLESQFGKEFTRDITSMSEADIKRFGIERGLTTEQIAGFRDLSERTRTTRVAKLLTKTLGAEAIGEIVGAASTTPGRTFGQAFRKGGLKGIYTLARDTARTRTAAGFGEGFVATRGALEFARPSKSFEIAGTRINLKASGILPKVGRTGKDFDINLGTVIPATVGGVVGAASAGGFAVFEKAAGQTVSTAVGYTTDLPELPGDISKQLFFPKALTGVPSKVVTPSFSYTKVFTEGGKGRAFSFERTTSGKEILKAFEFEKAPVTQQAKNFTDIKAKDVTGTRSPTKTRSKIKDITIQPGSFSLANIKTTVPAFTDALTTTRSNIPTKVDTKSLTKIDTKAFSPALTKTDTFALSTTKTEALTDTKVDTLTDTLTDTFTFTPTIFPPFPPAFPGGGGGDFFGRGRGIGGARGKYTPSLKAVALNIKSSTKQGLEGLGIRPIITSRSPRTKTKIVYVQAPKRKTKSKKKKR